MISNRRGILPLALLCTIPALASRAAAADSGEQIFRVRCSLCHSTTDESKQGPGLGGIVGRKAGTARFGAYTKALRDSGIVWDKATLDRFLKAPVELVPSTTMPMPLPDDAERRDVVAYLATLPAVTTPAPG